MIVNDLIALLQQCPCSSMLADSLYPREGLFVIRTGPRRVWIVVEAHLSEILRLAQLEGPQRIGTRRSFVVVPADEWDNKANLRKPLGRWLIENMPRGVEREVPERRSAREVPFSSEDDE